MSDINAQVEVSPRQSHNRGKAAQQEHDARLEGIQPTNKPDNDGVKVTAAQAEFVFQTERS